MRFWVIPIAALLCCIMVSAHDFEMDGIYYNITSPNNMTVEVTYKGDYFYSHENEYSDSVSIPSSTTYNGNIYNVTSIGANAFVGCTALTSITISASITSIGEDAFYRCVHLSNVYISDIAAWCNINFGYTRANPLYYARNLYLNGELVKELIIPNTITEIKHCAFSNYSNLTSITIPESVLSIGDGAFSECISLTSINIPQSVASIGICAFAGCSNLTSIIFAKNSKLERIGEDVFSDCNNIQELTLGEGLKRISPRAFSSSKGIKTITIFANRPPTTNGYIFTDEVYENATLHVPQNCVEKYQVMIGWSGFYNISEIEGGTPDYLTIHQADNGAVKIAVDLNRTYKAQIEPAEGWKIHSITFDGEDMTNLLDENYTFTTPMLTGSVILNVAYEQKASRVEGAYNHAIKVHGHEGTIFIEGTKQGDHIAIYTTGGMIVAEPQAEAAYTKIIVEPRQLYLVQVANKMVKILM